MTNFKEAIGHTRNLIKELDEKVKTQTLDRQEFINYMELITSDLILKIEHQENKSRALSDFSKN